MKTLSSKVSALLMATTALVAPASAFAQTEPATPAAAVQDAQEPEAATVDEIVVLGRYIPEPLRETSEVASFLNAEDLERTGDSNAAEALTRVTGLTISQGRFVYVRGLGERYSSARLNGSPLPSPEPLQRVVPLDLFPASILAGVTVQKTYSPNYPGEFGGGVIDLRTISAPTDPFFTMGVGVGGNTATTLQDGLVYFGSRTDFTGFDDGTRDMPTPLLAAMATGDRVVAGADFTDQQIQQIGWSFVNAPLNLLQREDQIPGDFEFDISAGQTFETGFGELGVVGLIGYDNSWQTREGAQGEGFLDLGELVARRDYDFRSTENNIGWDGLFGLSLGSGDHEVKWTNLYIRRTTKEARTREGFDFDAPGNGMVRDDFTAWYERELLNTQLAGEHVFGALEIDWRGAYAKTSRNAPYEKYIRYSVGDDGVPFHEGQRNSTSFSELDDEILSAGVDFAWTAPLSDARDLVVTWGAERSENERTSETRIFRFLFTGQSEEFQRQRVDFLFSDANQYPGAVQLTEITGSDGAAAYDGELIVNAAYAQIDAELIPLVRAAVGVRYEDAEQSVTPFDLFGGASPFTPTVVANSYWLPAATVTWNFAEDMQLRLGASKTIGRPQFRELAPQQYLDPDSDRLFIGNPFLLDTELTNLDARVEWFFERGQYVTAGVFYKDIENPVESAINDTGSVTQQTYLNAPQATLSGVELDGKVYFDSPMQGGFWDSKRWLLQANYTFTTSELKVEAGDLVFPLSGLGVGQPATNYFRDGESMQGQSEHIANLQFGWEDDLARSQATFLVNYASERSVARGRPGEPDLMFDPGVTLDFVYRKEFEAGGRDLKLGIELRNLTGREFEEYQEQVNRIDINRYDLGTSASVSLSASF